ncbi:retrovirus-related pol polyprotein from transposon TNT 1-94 [Tanacetum coccineum]
MKKVRKPTGKVFTKIRYSWKPTRRIFTIIGDRCPLTRITSKIVPPKEPTIALVKTSDLKVVQIVLWYLDSRCSKHMTGNRSQLINFVNKFLGTVRFENDHIAKIMGYGDYQMGNVTIFQVYYVEGLGHTCSFVTWKASKTKSWLWHKRLSHLNFDYINSLSKHGLVRGLPKLKPMRIQSINGRKYILVIVDDHSRFTWVKFLCSKDKVPEFMIKFLKMIQVRLNATVRNIRTDNGTEYVIQTLKSYYEEVRISHQTSVLQALLFLWAEAVATACYTQNRSLIQKCHNKTLYELLHDRKPDLSYLHVFGSLGYPTNDGEDLGMLRPKADIRIFVGYTSAKKAF